MAFLRTAVLLAVLFAIFIAVGYVFGGAVGMAFGFLFALILNLGVYWFSDSIVLRMYKAKPLHDARLNHIIKELSEKAGIPVPKAYIVETNIPNAFATGRSPNHSAIAVTRGLVESLSDKEITGVLAHEISHIKHRDTLISVMAATIAGALSWMTQIAIYSDRRGNENALMILIAMILAPIAAMLIQLAISRGREYYADKGGADISDPLGLASALEKISNFVKHGGGIKGNPSTAHMWIVNPIKGSSITNLFSTHPPIEERIKRLREMAR